MFCNVKVEVCTSAQRAAQAVTGTCGGWSNGVHVVEPQWQQLPRALFVLVVPRCPSAWVGHATAAGRARHSTALEVLPSWETDCAASRDAASRQMNSNGPTPVTVTRGTRPRTRAALQNSMTTGRGRWRVPEPQVRDRYMMEGDAACAGCAALAEFDLTRTPTGRSYPGIALAPARASARTRSWHVHSHSATSKGTLKQ